jgi:hypothetical protein
MVNLILQCAPVQDCESTTIMINEHSHADGTNGSAAQSNPRSCAHWRADRIFLSKGSTLTPFYFVPITNSYSTPARVTMIVDNDKSQGFSDAPPPYQHSLRSSSDSKVNLAPPSTSDSSSASRSSSRTTLSKRHPNARAKAIATPSRWFPTSIFGLSKTAKQVRSATQGFLRDLLSQARPCEHEWISVLDHCADTCSAHGLNFSALLQEPFVEGHLPVYWAVLKRPVAPAPVKAATPSNDPDSLVFAILDASIPLSPQCVADARLACMTVSDNSLFARLGRR